MSANPDLRDRPDPLPSMDRLLRVWDGVEKSTSSLEHATRVFVTVWILQFEGIDLRTVEDWSFTDHQAAVREKAVVLARAIDDEVTWHLGNRPELVTLVDDDSDAPTVGELLGQITMYAALFDKWPPGHGHIPFGPTFMVLGRLYDALVTNLVTGSARQPRRRSHGAPPIPEPRRVDLIAAPPDARWRP
ncbi:hypothetical protein ACW9HR_19045 [Nocardia gipuzkoensis]